MVPDVHRDRREVRDIAREGEQPAAENPAYTPERGVNTYAATVGFRHIEFMTAWPTYGPHIIRVVNLATASHPSVEIDVAVVIGP